MRAPLALCIGLSLAIGCGDPMVGEEGGRSDAGSTLDASSAAADGSGSLADASGSDTGPAFPCAWCDDNIACTVDRCEESGGCVHTPDSSICPAGSACSAEMGCVGRGACRSVDDCLDLGDPCFPVRCDVPTRTCVYSPLDGDGDQHTARVCGGDDCDDSDATVHGGATELCDGRDQNCDGAADAPLPDGACGQNEACVAGACACAGASTRCDTGCADVESDEANCGGCGTRCGNGQSCVAGSCACPSGTTDCGGWGGAGDTQCRDLTSDPVACGECGFSCIRGAVCVASRCECPSGTEACSNGCVDLVSSDPGNCGACGRRCLLGTECDVDACGQYASFLTAFSGYRASFSDLTLAALPDGALVSGRANNTLTHTRGTSAYPFYGTSIVRFDARGVPVWSFYYSAGSIGARRVAATSTGAAFGAASFSGTLWLGSHSHAASNGGIAVFGLDATGARAWSSAFSATTAGSAAITDLDADSNGLLVVGGLAGAPDLGGGPLPMGDGFVARFSTSGAHLASWRVPGTPRFGAADASGNVLVAGTFTGTISIGGTTLTAADTDVFVARYSETGTPLDALRIGAAGGDEVFALDAVGADAIVSSSDYLVARWRFDGTRAWARPRVVGASEVAPTDVVAIDETIWVVGSGGIGFDFGGQTLDDPRMNAFVARYSSVDGALRQIGAVEGSIGSRDVDVNAIAPVSGVRAYVAGVYDHRVVVGGEYQLDDSYEDSGFYVTRIEASP